MSEQPPSLFRQAIKVTADAVVTHPDGTTDGPDQPGHNTIDTEE